jgi:L-fucose isomerase-like protein
LANSNQIATVTTLGIIIGNRGFFPAHSLTSLHTMDPHSPHFRADLLRFVGTCNLVGRLKNARIGTLGVRPAAFNTAPTKASVAEAIHDALTTYLGWNIYHHR